MTYNMSVRSKNHRHNNISTNAYNIKYKLSMVI